MSGQGGRGLQRLGGGLTAGVLIVAAVAVAFGTGFTASRTILGEGGAWLSSGRTVTHVNSGTGQPDATIDGALVDEVGDQEIVPSDQGVAVVDRGDGSVTSLDTTTMTTGRSGSLDRGSGRTRFVVAGRFGYLIRDDVVQPVDPVTMEHRGRAVEVGHVAGAVATAEGTLVVLDAGHGTVVELVGADAELPVEVAPRPSREHLDLTAVSGRPVVVDTRAGSVRRLRPGPDPESPVRVPGLAGTPIADVAVADPHADGTTVWLVRRPDGQLVGVDLDTGRVRSGRLDHPGPGLQPPVVLQGLVYVPDGQSREVAVVDGTSDGLHRIARHEPDGSGSRLEVFAQDGRVWINDPSAPRALVVEANGRDWRVVDKGTGQGLDGPDDGPSRPGPASGGPAPGPGTPQPGPGVAPTGGSPAPAAGPPARGPGGPGGPPPSVPPPQNDVPRVVGLDRDEACDRITDAQLVCDPRPVAEAPDGTRQDEVVSQDPAGGRLAVLSPVVVEYYSPDPVAVDDVTGLRVAQGGEPQAGPACQAVIQQGFTCVPRSVPAAPNRPADEVLSGSQEPGSGSEQVPGEDVAFDYASTALVPDLTGMTEAQACAAVTALNLVCVPQYVTIGATPGRVNGQSPLASTPAAADTQVTIQVPQRTSSMPGVVGLDQGGACAALAAEQLQCSPAVNPAPSLGNPGLVDSQQYAQGTALAPGTAVTIYFPPPPDVTLHLFQAYTAAGQPMQRWAMAPDGGPGRNVYDMFTSPQRASLWRPVATVGRCYSSQVPGSSPLHAFMRRSPDDPDHELHFYSDGGPGDEQYERGVDYYGQPTGVLCYVIPWDAARGATHVHEWWKDQDHYWTAGGGAPGSGYTQVNGHWMTW